MRADLRVDLPVGGVRLSLWRALAAFRAAALVFDVVLVIRWQHLYARPRLGVLVALAMIVTTAAVGWLGVRGRAHRAGVVLGDIVVTYVLTLLTLAVQTGPQAHGGMITLTSIWAAGPTIETAFLLGPVAGVGAGIVQYTSTVVVAGSGDGRTLYNGVLLVIIGAVVGLVARFAIRAEAELRAAATAQAALAERERLARSIHDGVLQVLGLVHRATRDEGGRWAELAAAAAEQEAALRALITSRPPARPGAGADLGAMLRALRSTRVTVSTPAETVTLGQDAAAEVASAVRAALHNVEAHAGDGAHAWVLLESLAGELRVTVRDDGCGMAPGRIEAARLEGRLGLDQSVQGRVTDLGGRCTITSSPGEGTLIELAVPCGEAAR